MTYEQWVVAVPAAFSRDALWRMIVYRKSMFLADLAWSDVMKLGVDPRTRALSDQLYLAIGSIVAKIAEGYSRGSGRDRVRFYESSLGSARESRDWYYKARHLLGDKVFTHRALLLEEIIELLLTTIPQQRGQSF